MHRWKPHEKALYEPMPQETNEFFTSSRAYL